MVKTKFSSFPPRSNDRPCTLYVVVVIELPRYAHSHRSVVVVMINQSKKGTGGHEVESRINLVAFPLAYPALVLSSSGHPHHLHLRQGAGLLLHSAYTSLRLTVDSTVT
jgi:hypothetical protein